MGSSVIRSGFNGKSTAGLNLPSNSPTSSAAQESSGPPEAKRVLLAYALAPVGALSVVVVTVGMLQSRVDLFIGPLYGMALLAGVAYIAGALLLPLAPSTLAPVRLRARVENPHMWNHFHRAL